MKDLEILDKWFLENENCTYKEFCKIYNLEKELTGNLPFIEFPKPILNILQKNIDKEWVSILPQKLVDFLTQEGALSNYIDNIKKYETIYNFMNRDLDSPTIIDLSFHWAATLQGHNYWSRLNNKYQKL